MQTLGWRLTKWVRLTFTALCFVFLLGPLLIVIPLSFNAEPYFTFTEAMLTLEPEGFSLRWYRNLIADDTWSKALLNSLFIGISATLIATVLGTLAAIGLSRPSMPARQSINALLISPMITPIIIVGIGVFFFYSNPLLDLAQTYLGLILAHAVLGAPFVVITVTATLAGFDYSLLRAAASLGATSWTAFFRIQLPLISPGVATGALFAFVTSFDEVVVVLFMGGLEQRTIPRQMWNGIREEINPTILAVATLLILFAVAVLFAVELLRSRMDKSTAS